MQRRTRSHADELKMVSIDIVMQIKAECRMNAGNKYGFRKRRSKGICAESECDTVVAINVRCGDGGDDSKRGRSELEGVFTEMASLSCGGSASDTVKVVAEL
jgi:hypothetical protein